MNDRPDNPTSDAPPATPPATPSNAPTPAAAGATPLTTEQATRIVDERLAKERSADELAEKRRQFTANFMVDLPDAYRRQLGGDPDKWMMEARFIQEQYRKDFGPIVDQQRAAAGVDYRQAAAEPNTPSAAPPPPFGGAMNPLATPPPHPPGNIDFTKVGGGSPSKVIGMGLAKAHLRPGVPRRVAGPTFPIY